MTEWAPGTAPTTTWDQEAGMLPSGEDQTDNVENLVERAETAATNAETAETNAETAETNAETAQAAAETAQGLAEDAQTAAEAAQSAAETAETNAETAQTAAESAQADAETAETNAETAQAAAEDAQSYAEEWANKAEDSLVSVEAGGDGSTEYSALHHAAKASASATSASSAQSAAESARDATLAAYDQFDDRYLGAKASDPALDNDGNALVGGALYFNTTDEAMKIYTGTEWQVAYANLSTSDTDDLSEGSTNLYYTDARVQAVSINNVVEDTTPQLGGTLDANGNTIDMGVNTVSDTKVGQWDTAYGWGDHSTVGYLTSFTETNDLSTAVTWANVPDANITESSVTQHQAALSIANTQVTGLGTAATTASTDYATAAQGALADTATQPGDLGTAAALDVGTGANNVVQLDGSGALPAVDGSNLTNVSSVASINDLTDVTITSVADGESLVYDSGTSQWVNETVTSVSLSFPFFDDTGASDPIALISNQNLPFFQADGTQDNIAVVS